MRKKINSVFPLNVADVKNRNLNEIEFVMACQMAMYWLSINSSSHGLGFRQITVYKKLPKVSNFLSALQFFFFH